MEDKCTHCGGKLNAHTVLRFGDVLVCTVECLWKSGYQAGRESHSNDLVPDIYKIKERLAKLEDWARNHAPGYFDGGVDNG